MSKALKVGTGKATRHYRQAAGFRWDPSLGRRQRLPIRGEGTNTEERRCSHLAPLPFFPPSTPGLSLGTTTPRTATWLRWANHPGLSSQSLSA